jgi:Tfp pilus assembly protein PilO
MPAAWRARWWRWSLPLAFVLANAVFLIVHPGRTGAGFADVEAELERETRELQALTDKERAIEAVLETARSNREALAVLYGERFATEAERLTRLITEVKKLAQRAGLEPKSISYPEEKLEEYGLVRMSLVFAVQGTYPQLRMLINLLERSDLFLVLDRIGLNDANASILGISLQLSTFFAREPEASSSETRRTEARQEPRALAGRARS